MQNLFITETHEGAGKTALTLGLTIGFLARGLRVGFIKPVGRATREGGKRRVDEDTLLISRATRVHCNLDDMNPVDIGAGFPDTFNQELVRDGLLDKLDRAYARVADGKELVIIEGTGHAAVGAAFGLSNAFVCSRLKAKVLLVSAGGIGHPVDEILLNRQYFEMEGVSVAGVVINKVFASELDRVRRVTTPILKAHGIPLFGTIPYEEEMTRPTVLQVVEELRGDLINGDSQLGRRAGTILAGAMTAHHALDRMEGDILLVTPGDREDLILGALTIARMGPPGRLRVTAMVLTGGIYPCKSVLEILRRTDIPVLVVREHTYNVAARLRSMVVRVSPWDQAKIDRLVEVVRDNVDQEALLKVL